MLPGLARGMMSGGLTAESFTALMLSAGGSELIEFYLAHNTAQFRTLGTGVSSLIGQKAGFNATQATGSKQPTVQAGAASNGRDAFRFTRTAGSALITGADFVSTSTQRWAVLFIGKLNTSPPVATGRPFEWGIPAAGGDALSIHFFTTPTLTYNVNANGDSVSVAYNSTAPLAMAVACSNLHKRYLNGTWTDMVGNGQIGSRGNGNVTLGIGRACDADTGFIDMDLWAMALFKMSGTAVPSGFAGMLALARTYYAEAGL